MRRALMFYAQALIERHETAASKRASAAGHFKSSAPAVTIDVSPSPKKRRAKAAKVDPELWTRAEERLTRVRHFEPAEAKAKKTLKKLVAEINDLGQEFDAAGSTEFTDWIAKKKVDQPWCLTGCGLEAEVRGFAS
ncbi:hypothetical protein AK812_SmicGene44679 [Symbiodinium microadriaticum]|uniref:Uncharacterized protein n=1 Tax=Symbiodinium microadriaticum TaxID=2951 RepID=A0A1Q9BXY0_SYMMI|nr:hypothetical protein AK812_SmicGene44679 [Symbiodinium microadriaticum]